MIGIIEKTSVHVWEFLHLNISQFVILTPSGLGHVEPEEECIKLLAEVCCCEFLKERRELAIIKNARILSKQTKDHANAEHVQRLQFGFRPFFLADVDGVIQIPDVFAGCARNSLLTFFIHITYWPVGFNQEFQFAPSGGQFLKQDAAMGRVLVIAVPNFKFLEIAGNDIAALVWLIQIVIVANGLFYRF